MVSVSASKRRFLAFASRMVSDNEMVHVLQVGLSGSFLKVAALVKAALTLDKLHKFKIKYHTIVTAMVDNTLVIEKGEYPVGFHSSIYLLGLVLCKPLYLTLELSFVFLGTGLSLHYVCIAFLHCKWRCSTSWWLWICGMTMWTDDK